MVAYHDPAFVAAREKLGEAIKEFAKETQDEVHVVLAATVVFETTLFDDEGHQNYATRHVITDGSLSQAVGLLATAQTRLITYINAPDPEGDD